MYDETILSFMTSAWLISLSDHDDPRRFLTRSATSILWNKKKTHMTLGARVGPRSLLWMERVKPQPDCKWVFITSLCSLVEKLSYWSSCETETYIFSTLRFSTSASPSYQENIICPYIGACCPVTLHLYRVIPGIQLCDVW